MGGPFEVWAKPDGSHGDNTGFWQSEEYRDDGTVRYLRADLTCGECKHFGDTYDEAQDTACHRKHDTLHQDGDPACMAFQRRT